MFESLEMAPPDPILGLSEAFQKDTNPDKINLGVGVYKDQQGATPVLASVKEAERRLLGCESSKSYLPIGGAADYGRRVRELLLGGEHVVLGANRALTAHTPGGTGGLRVVGDYLKANHPKSTLWLSEPTWANHPAVFQAAGVPMQRYPYFDPAGNGLAFEAMIACLGRIPEGDVVLLHGCCHNPTGVDPTLGQWEKIVDVLAQRKLLPLVDFAYQGFGDGIGEDAAGLRALCAALPELLICSSFSKNFGLYNERVGALTIVAGSAGAAEAVFSHLKVAIRRNYSNPPAHGAAIVTTILDAPSLRQQWEEELARMRDRINRMRRLFVSTLAAKGAGRDFSFIQNQRGMFSFSGLNQGQVQALRGKHSIYIVGSGRINVAGMTEANMDRLCAAIVSVS